jgi:N-6 DNA Methylase
VISGLGPPHISQRIAPQWDTSRSGGDLARAFGWTDPNFLSREIRRGGTRLDIARCAVGGEPAALFATVGSRNGFDPLDSAALYAYHATVDWGLLADDSGMTVFNSHWLLDGDWFRLPKIGWNDVDANADLIEALTPAGLLDGAIERFASRRREPTAFLKAVDDELVERLDGWRDQALRYARDVERVDERLQTLYAQLFVLRTIEDRGLDPTVPSLESVLSGSETIDNAQWRHLLEVARTQIGSDLFDHDIVPIIPEHVVAGVIRDLYRPRGLPGADARYDFSWIEADVLGLAYEKYLATILQAAPAAPQTEMFFVPEREVERLTVRKRSGAYYTPKFISGYLATHCVDDFFARSPGDGLPRVIDFACGSGSFLVAAVDRILVHLKARDSNRRWARELVEGGHVVVGIDIDAKAVTAARLHLWQRLVQEPGALPLPNLSDVVVVADGLKRETWGDLDQPYDIVLGNPPFMAINLIQDREVLEAKFTTPRGVMTFPIFSSSKR